MTKSVLVIGHADADGHLITEQVRRNLELVGEFEVSTFVDPNLTHNHRVWTKLNSIEAVRAAEIVFFVDLMFSPAQFAEEASAVTKFVQSYPEKRFFLIDHHPLPYRRLAAADNLRVLYRPDVFECTVGPRSGMMVVAALCEKQRDRVSDIVEPEHELLARGMRRAAALGGPLPGEKLLSILRSNCWEELAELGAEDRVFHRLPRGRRPAAATPSVALSTADKVAKKLLGSHGKTNQGSKPLKVGKQMPYDIEETRYAYDVAEPTTRRNVGPSSRDLEAIVTVLEIAALSLTTVLGATFTLQELVAEAKRIAGKKVVFDDRDIKIVMEKWNFLEKVGSELRLK